MPVAAQPVNRPARRRLSGLVAGAMTVAGLGVATLAVGAPAQAAGASNCTTGSDGSQTCTTTFAATGSGDTFTVPAGVTSMGFDVRGAQGGEQRDPGGAGGVAAGSAVVTPGATIVVLVGQAGTLGGAASASGGAGGVAPGNPDLNGGSGGGGSFVFDTTDDVTVIAGGGGGTSGNFPGGPGGGAGTSYEDGGYSGTAEGATATRPGRLDIAGGSASASVSGSTITPGTGGTGASSTGSNYYGGGGGGGGWYGGGGGQAHGPGTSPSDHGGGGGSGHVSTSVVIDNSDSSTGGNEGPGSVKLTYVVPSMGPVVTTTSLPNGVYGTSYSQTLTATSGTAPYTWSIGSGALPAGVSLSAGGTISGTPTAATAAGSPAEFTVRVTDASNHSDDQQLTVAIAKAAQAPTITSTAPMDATVEGPAYQVDYLATAGTGTGAATVVVDNTTTRAACSVDATGSVAFDHAGICALRVDQAGTDNYAAGSSAAQPFTVGKGPQIISTSTVPDAGNVGDVITFTATGGDSQNPVDDTPTSTGNGCTVSSQHAPDGDIFTVTLTTIGTCALELDQAGSDDYTTAEEVPVSITSRGRATTTAVAVDPHSLVATVGATTARPSTVAAPTGTVDFYVAGTKVGTAPLTDGTATMATTVAPGQTQQVDAVYSADTHWAGSTGTTTRRDPTIAAVVTSSAPASATGWYHTPVTVSFTCAPGSAALATACPTPVTLNAGVEGRTATGTVTATDGGAATVSTGPINIDLGNPDVTIVGAHGRHPHCGATDARSGIASCTIERKVRRNRVVIVATATDGAGNTKTRRIVIRRHHHG